MSSLKGAVLALLTTVALAALISVLVPDDAAAGPVEMTFEDDDAIRTARGLNPLTWNYTVKHNGTPLSEEFMTELRNEPYGWQHFYAISTGAGVRTSTNELEYILMRYEVAPMSLTVTPPVFALAGIYWMTVNTYLKKDPSKNESHDIAVIIGQFASWELVVHNEPPGGEFQAIPPSTVTARVALYNIGNGADRFLIQAESSRSNEGWTITFASGVDEYGWTPELQPDPGKQAPHLIDISVPIPAATRADVTCQVVVNATSQFNTSKQEPPAYFTVRALQYYNFQVHVVGYDTKEGTPGENVTFQFEIENLGNGEDIFTCAPVWDGELNPGFCAVVDPGSVAVDVDWSGFCLYTVEVPLGAAKKTYFFTVEVASSCPELAVVVKSFAVEVSQVHKIELGCATPMLSSIPGGILDFTITVTNAGTGLDSVVMADLVYFPRGWLDYFQPPEVTLLVGASANVTLRIIIPWEFEEAPIGLYEFVVVAESQRSDATATLSIWVKVLQFFRVEWMLGGEPITNPDRPVAPSDTLKPKLKLDLSSDTLADRTLELCNFGNGDDNVTVSASTEADGLLVSAAPETTLLMREQTKPFRVTIEVGPGLIPGLYVVSVTATSQDPDHIPRVVTLEVLVEGVLYDISLPDAPDVFDGNGTQLASDNLTVLTNQTITFRFRVTNTGDGDVSGVQVMGFSMLSGPAVLIHDLTTSAIPAGSHIDVGAPPYTEDNPRLDWTAGAEGVYIVHFTGTIDHPTDGSDDTCMVVITAIRPPQAVVTNPEDGETVSGSVEVTGTASTHREDIEWVKVRVDGGEWRTVEGTEDWSIVFDVSELPPGSHSIEVVTFDGEVESPPEVVTFYTEEPHVKGSPGLGALAAVLSLTLAAAILGRRKRHE